MRKLVLHLVIRVSLALLMVSVLPSLAWAGAWPREVGQTFLSFGTSIDVAYDDPSGPRTQFHTLYGEYGLRPKLTLGLDAGLNEAGDYTAIVFARRPIMEQHEDDRFAIQAGLGLTETAAGRDYLIQTGFAWGRGITTPLGSGWMSLDTSVEYRLESEDIVTKADFTIGVKGGERTKFMVQVQSGAYPGSDPFLRLAPSVARQFGEGRHVVLEAHFGVIGDETAGIKLGTWLEF